MNGIVIEELDQPPAKDKSEASSSHLVGKETEEEEETKGAEDAKETEDLDDTWSNESGCSSQSESVTVVRRLLVSVRSCNIRAYIYNTYTAQELANHHYNSSTHKLNIFHTRKV